jgi:SAM-dependent methyltransferase
MTSRFIPGVSMARLVSQLAGLLPPAARRTAAGMWLDAKSLPARALDPTRRNEPWQTLHNVGGGDFAKAGQENLELLRAYAGLTPASDVLDIGCGTGRMAWPLATYLLPNAGYLGFDVSARAVELCRRRFGAIRPDFAFVEADVANTEYRAGGAGREDSYRFPVEDNGFDVAFATSVFSHMTLPSIRHYLSETARALRPGGHFLFTGYALTAERMEGLARGEGRFAFKPWRDEAMVVDPRSPERAIAHPLPRFLAAITDSGLELAQPVRMGVWLGPSDYPGGQDLFVVRKPAAA